MLENCSAQKLSILIGIACLFVFIKQGSIILELLEKNQQIDKATIKTIERINFLHKNIFSKRENIAIISDDFITPEKQLQAVKQELNEKQAKLNEYQFLADDLDILKERIIEPADKGVSKTTNCAILVPFRKRHEQRVLFEKYMIPFLREQGVNATIVFIDQVDERPFNRGSLLNIGFVVATEIFPNISYLIFHDIDQLPIGKVNYGYEELKGMVLGPYPTYVGGVFKLDARMFRDINGFPNCYWGWGGEDDNFYERLKTHRNTRAMLQDRAVPADQNRYFTNCHAPGQNERYSDILRLHDVIFRNGRDFFQTEGNTKRIFDKTSKFPKPFYTFDGISTLNYTIQNTLFYPSNIIEVQVKLLGRSLDDCIDMYQSYSSQIPFN